MIFHQFHFLSAPGLEPTTFWLRSFRRCMTLFTRIQKVKCQRLKYSSWFLCYRFCGFWFELREKLSGVKNIIYGLPLARWDTARFLGVQLCMKFLFFKPFLLPTGVGWILWWWCSWDRHLGNQKGGWGWSDPVHLPHSSISVWTHVLSTVAVPIGPPFEYFGRPTWQSRLLGYFHHHKDVCSF